MLTLDRNQQPYKVIKHFQEHVPQHVQGPCHSTRSISLAQSCCYASHTYTSFLHTFTCAQDQTVKDTEAHALEAEVTQLCGENTGF
ncbi:uncharacterized protein BJ212DRAFT_1285610 [Suillus subaureus]|uniref:Uncharacterized protein n=1 Tax=Suillus subaureus TaxID=48587 RepID=A0A9P7DTX9_9AGAM|nr:uncharacterized protein BJ212DRAFT_1285610 [Suillus subaureus]KAG1802977.1 hypothetical protein BJ212DRAFT_1285610 [Suillus subaureus]